MSTQPSVSPPSPDVGPLRVLIIDDDANHAEAVAESLRRVGHDCSLATSGKAGARAIEDEERLDVVLTDLRMADVDGLTLLRKSKLLQPDCEVVLITGYGDVKTAVEAIKQGASHYLLKPVDMAELRAIVAKSAERAGLIRANRELKRQLDEKFGFEGVIGNSPKMRKVLDDLKRYAATNTTVLILGDTGTGKELVAKSIHTNSPRKNKPYVAMNCTAFNENLLDDELFGHEAGAFTGADRLRKGRFEHANGGTLFLDEVGDMPLSLQAKLLRVLENQEVFRIGSNEPIKVNVRVISATHRNLEEEVAAGRFRKDLMYRLKIGTMRLPSLSDRREDIPLLAAHFIKDFNHRHGTKVVGIADPVRKAMAAYSWPGNVRELRNILESMVVQDRDGVLGLDDLQDGEGLRSVVEPAPQALGPTNLLGRTLREIERYYIEQTLIMCDGNRDQASHILGIGERTLYRMMQEWQVQGEIRKVLAETAGDLETAAARLKMKVSLLERKMRKWNIKP